MPQYEAHPYASLIPEASAIRLKEIAESVREHGLFDPITLYQDRVLDGRTRLAACEASDVEPRFTEFEGDDLAAINFVEAHGAMRRDLTDAQRVTIQLECRAARSALVAAKDRLVAGRKRGGEESGRTRRGERTKSTASDAVDLTPKKRHPSAQDTALAAGVGTRQVEQAQEIEAKAPDLYEKMKAGKIRTTGAAYKEMTKRRQVATIAAEPPPLPTGPFRVIVIDPPWRYDNRAEDTTHRGRLPYPDMSPEEIEAMAVSDLAGSDCILWLWTTNAFMHDAYHIADAWGFQVKTILTWAKTRMGVGDWLRGQTEHCLMGVRGKPLVTLTNQTTLLTAAAGKHSEKPEEFYQMVEALCPGSKAELFSRKEREGWASHGDEVPGD